MGLVPDENLTPGGLFDLCPYLNSVCCTDSVSSSG